MERSRTMHCALVPTRETTVTTLSRLSCFDRASTKLDNNITDTAGKSPAKYETKKKSPI